MALPSVILNAGCLRGWCYEPFFHRTFRPSGIVSVLPGPGTTTRRVDDNQRAHSAQLGRAFQAQRVLWDVRCQRISQFGSLVTVVEQDRPALPTEAKPVGYAEPRVARLNGVRGQGPVKTRM